MSPFITNELDPAIPDLRLTPTPPDPSWTARIKAATPRDALAEIVARARNTSIVLINEAHYTPRDRAFALEVARALRPLGYSVLAAEAFVNEHPDPDTPAPIAQLKADGFVRRGTGHYTRDPVFAGFVREALAMGYEPIAYEQTQAQTTPDGGIPEREEAQADNLMARLRERPGAKVLIHVGHGHLQEEPIGTGDDALAFMGARLKRKSGVDPLTIDQTSVTEMKGSTRPAYLAAAARIGRRPAVFFEGDRPLVLIRAPGSVDLQVVHPARAYRHGRPTWLAALGGRPVAVPRALMPATGRALVQAYAADAPDDAVPLDQVLVEAGRPAPMLMLPAGRLRFAVEAAEPVATVSR